MTRTAAMDAKGHGLAEPQAGDMFSQVPNLGFELCENIQIIYNHITIKDIKVRIFFIMMIIVVIVVMVMVMVMVMMMMMMTTMTMITIMKMMGMMILTIVYNVSHRFRTLQF